MNRKKITLGEIVTIYIFPLKNLKEITGETIFKSVVIDMNLICVVL